MTDRWDIAALLEEARSRVDAEVLPPRGMPSTPTRLPEDLAQFYALCGGLRFVGWAPEIAIVGPERLVPADPVVLGEDSGDPLPRGCCVIAESDEGTTAEDSYPGRGSMGVVALSFTELVGMLLEFDGEDGELFPYWLADDFEAVADAYDDIP